MRSSGHIIWRAAEAGFQWPLTTASCAPRFPKIVGLTQVSNAVLTRKFGVVAHSQNIRKRSSCSQLEVEWSTSTHTGRMLTKSYLTASRSSIVRRHTTSSMASSQNETAQQWTAPKVRETFIRYFEEHGHLFGETASSQLFATTHY